MDPIGDMIIFYHQDGLLSPINYEKNSIWIHLNIIKSIEFDGDVLWYSASCILDLLQFFRLCWVYRWDYINFRKKSKLNDYLYPFNPFWKSLCVHPFEKHNFHPFTLKSADGNLTTNKARELFSKLLLKKVPQCIKNFLMHLLNLNKISINFNVFKVKICKTKSFIN